MLEGMHKQCLKVSSQTPPPKFTRVPQVHSCPLSDDVLLEYENVISKEVDTINIGDANEHNKDVMISIAKNDNPRRLWCVIEKTLGATKITDIKTLKTEISYGIVDSSNHHGISREYTAENYIRAWEKTLPWM